MGPFFVVVLFLIIQVFASRVISSSSIGKVKWMSFAGGIAVSYIFVYILPSLHHEQQEFGDSAMELAMESELYVLGLVGIILFFVINRLAERHRHAKGNTIEDRFFFVQSLLFFSYNALLSYILFAGDQNLAQLLFYGMAAGLHFMAVAHDMYRENAEKHRLYGRWMLAAGILTGWLTAVLTPPSPFALSIAFAFLAGSMTFNVIKNEIPSEGDAHLPTFVLSAGIYTALTTLLKLFFNW
ncbi:hypothetical protein C6I21_06740 [Alkalicoccus urumqiensis]|uniref:Zinc permease n=1 Tax=Alkalicoccus urumqiensis TaxID=1548213 RepID=A0A2P6MI76_ALKUR|nr:hypothetical protein C6I21_06740 [Alkalicoccus urumqiensis]